MRFVEHLKIVLSFVIILLCNNLLTNAQSNSNAVHLKKSFLLVNFLNDSSVNDRYTLAHSFLEQSKPDKAMEILFQLVNSVDCHSELIDKINISIAEAYRQKREYKKGLDLLYTTINNPRTKNEDKVWAYTRIAAIYNEWRIDGDYHSDSVVYYSQLAIRDSEISGYKEYLATACNELGYIYIQQKNYRDAIALLEKSKALYFNLGKYSHSASVSINLSNAYLYYGNMFNAENEVDSAINLISASGNDNLLMRLYLQKAKVNEIKGDFRIAYEYLSKGRHLQRKFYDDRLDTEIFEMSAKYDLELKEARIREEQLKSEKQKQQSLILIVMLIILIVFLVSTLYIVVLQRKNLKQKQELVSMQNQMFRNEIDFKNKELTNSIASSIATDKLMEEIKIEIVNKNYSEALNILNSNISTDKKWQSFLLKFNEQNPDFFAKLDSRFPNLTETETKLAAFLKMGLKSREIASIMNIELTSVDKNRQRLRKKLDLDTDVNLNEFFDSL